MPGELGIDVVEERCPVGRAVRLDLFDDFSNLFERFFSEALVGLGREELSLREMAHEPVERIFSDPRLDVVVRAIARGVVARRMWGDAVGEELDERGAVTGARSFDGLVKHVVDGYDVVAV